MKGLRYSHVSCLMSHVMYNIYLACTNAAAAKTKEDHILIFKWNDAGLTARIAIAAANGWTNNAGAPVTTAEDMKEFIARFLTLAPNGGIDLGDHHDVFQFLPSYRRDAKMMALITDNLFLCHHGLGCTFANPAAQQAATLWPDIVYYLQSLMTIKSNAAVGPTDLDAYFNA